MRENTLLRELPWEVCLLQNLKKLDVGGNGMDSIPPQIGMSSPVAFLCSLNKYRKLSAAESARPP